MYIVRAKSKLGKNVKKILSEQIKVNMDKIYGFLCKKKVYLCKNVNKTFICTSRMQKKLGVTLLCYKLQPNIYLRKWKTSKKPKLKHVLFLLINRFFGNISDNVYKMLTEFLVNCQKQYGA